MRGEGAGLFALEAFLDEAAEAGRLRPTGVRGAG